MALNQTYQNTLPYFVTLKGLKNAPKIFTANLFFILIFTILRTRLCCTRKKKIRWMTYWLLTHFWKANYEVVGVEVAVPHLLWINSRSETSQQPRLVGQVNSSLVLRHSCDLRHLATVIWSQNWESKWMPDLGSMSLFCLFPTSDR